MVKRHLITAAVLAVILLAACGRHEDDDNALLFFNGGGRLLTFSPALCESIYSRPLAADELEQLFGGMPFNFSGNVHFESGGAVY